MRLPLVARARLERAAGDSGFGLVVVMSQGDTLTALNGLGALAPEARVRGSIGVSG